MKLIVGLGNPGSQYDNTRHNVGFDTIKILADQFNIELSSKSKTRAVQGTGSIDGQKVMLVMPMTFMNLSGESVYEIYKNSEILLEDIIVVHDEMDLDDWIVRIKKGGSSAGHNGLESIIQRLGSKEFIRVRIGIGKPLSKEYGADHVLSSISPSERPEKDKAIRNAADSVILIIDQGLSKAMNEINRA